jgi:hypothetical protein
MFTETDIAAAIAYNSTAVFTFYDRTKSGAIRFDVRNLHVTELNKLMQRKLLTEADFAQFKKQIRSAIKSTVAA